MEDVRFALDNFELYRLARQYRQDVYRLIPQLPPVEAPCLGRQMRRAAVSITNNIAQGHGRWHYQENIHFCRIARGSVSEILDDLNVCLDEQFADPVVIEQLKIQGYGLIAKINGYIAYLKRCKQESA